ncbi:AAEL012354-PA [Aedes aegypti]|uniref:AAEL012354-PA n=1 Tax=Aedes aegypti TaxID=7159 RepID=Q16MB9_AEDAE|nr:AAEL012354-PA [Aedes aegypti]
MLVVASAGVVSRRSPLISSQPMHNHCHSGGNYPSKSMQHSPNLNESDFSTHEYSHLKVIDLEEISSKVLKRIGDLLTKPLIKDNEIELTKRILDIKERQEEVKLAIGVASQTTPSEKVSDTMTNLEKVSKSRQFQGMRDLSIHFDETIAALVSLNKSGSREAANMLSEHESAKILAMMNESSPYKGTSDLSDISQNTIVHDVGGNSLSSLIQSIKELLAVPVIDNTEESLNKRLVDVQRKQEELRLIVGKEHSNTKVLSEENMDVLEKVTKELSIHCDEVVNALAALNSTRIDTEKSYSQSSESTVATSENQEMEGYVPGSFAAKSKAKIVATALTNNFDKSVTQIVEWLEMEREMLKKHCIVVGDCDMILESIGKQKNMLVELESKKPHLDELVKTADSLRTELNKQYLHSKDLETARLNKAQALTQEQHKEYDSQRVPNNSVC